MKYEVWHVKNPTFQMGYGGEFPTAYEKVAEVDCKDLEHAFEVTNHIDHDWATNSEVTKRAKKPLRSTSVGDVLVDENGVKMMVAPVGWEEI